MNKNRMIAKHCEGDDLRGPKGVKFGTFTLKNGEPAFHMKSGKVYIDVTLLDLATTLFGKDVVTISITFADGTKVAA